MFANFDKIYSQSSIIKFIDSKINNKDTKKIGTDVLPSSSLSVISFQLFKKVNNDIVILLPNFDEAELYYNDLLNISDLTDEKKNIFFLPHTQKINNKDIKNEQIVLQTHLLNHIVNQKDEKRIIVTDYKGATEKIILQDDLTKNTLKISVKDSLELDFLIEYLFSIEFVKVDYVSSPEEFSTRGGILDVFSFAEHKPFRIEFIGNQVESIRFFNVENQLSINKIDSATIIPNLGKISSTVEKKCIIDFLPSDAVVINRERLFIESEITRIDKEYIKKKLATKEELTIYQNKYIESNTFFNKLNQFKQIVLNSTQEKISDFYPSQIQPQPSFNKNFNLLIKTLNEFKKKDYSIFIFCQNENQNEKLKNIFEELSPELNTHFISKTIYKGFIDNENKVIAFTDHEIFNRIYKSTHQTETISQRTIVAKLKQWNSLQKGDYITHIDHGIGVFEGIQKIDNNGILHDSLRIRYDKGDLLFVNIHSLHKITKYNSKDGIVPSIHRLGSGAWAKIKQKTQKHIKHLAFDLISLYAKRLTKKGFACNPDTYLQAELESSFIYEDTPDQFKATEEVKKDMESEKPMDRLICGDVGFGKTEIAIRAAFKAVDNGLQVAVLVPTTVLAFQHFKTFTKRLYDLSVKVDYLNRFRKPADKKRISEELNTGKIEIIIGTQQLLNKNVSFKNLGLLIIDEEQKFGVNVKEKFKTIKTSIDTLTLSATPIPRTLQFSLMSARDLSIINTPPPNRLPIQTQIIPFDINLISNAIKNEIDSGGQVFLVNDRIKNLEEIVEMLKGELPNIRIAIGQFTF